MAHAVGHCSGFNNKRRKRLMKRTLSRYLAGTAIVGALIASGCGGGQNDAASPSAEPAQAAPQSAGEAVAPEATTETTAADTQEAAGEGDPARGKRVFVKCMACHSATKGENRAGPSLYKIVGAPAGQAANFNYSPAITSSGLVWTEDVLAAYLENPAKYLPGNKMFFPGLPSAQDRADVILYLKSLD
jgi:cytochrome c